jgi:ABC-type dipeptide/oligopeptide/nickel transport system permease component
LAGILLAIAGGVSGGIFVTRHPNGFLDRALGLLSMIFISCPSYVVALVLLLVFAVHWRIFPALGTSTSSPLEYLWSLILPAIALALPWWGYLSRVVRGNMLEVMGSTYIKTAASLGYPQRTIFYKYALKNALIPITSLLGLMVGYMLGGTIFVEVIFGRPGLGSLAVGAIATRNWPVVRGAVFVFALFYLGANLIADISHHYLDPRIRMGSSLVGEL